MSTKEVYVIKWPRFWKTELVTKHIHEWTPHSCFPGHSVKVCICGAVKGSKNGIIIYRLWEKLEENRRTFQYAQRPVHKDPPNYCKPL